VHLDGRAQRSCVLPMAGIAGKRITTIEGLTRGAALHPVQEAWLETDAVQCGWCQAGQIMAAVELLDRTPDPTEDQLDAVTNLCRCGTHPRIRRAAELLGTRA
jgi:isoquinoline 1-oxidoreductase alpha subunit